MRLVPCLPALAIFILGDGAIRADPLAQTQTQTQTQATEVPDVVVEPPWTAPAPAVSVPAPDPTRMIVVHIDSARQVLLQLQDRYDDERYRTVCASPCDGWVPRQGQYRIVAGEEDEFAEIDKFTLPARALRDSIEVVPRSCAKLAIGTVLTVTGGLATLIGAVWLLGAVVLSGYGREYYGGSGSTDYLTAPLLVLLGGGGALAGGIILIRRSGTHVSQSDPVSGSAAGSPWARSATWFQESPEKGASGHVMAAPIFRIVF